MLMFFVNNCLYPIRTSISNNSLLKTGLLLTTLLSLTSSPVYPAGATGVQGPKGPAGPRGDKGIQGVQGIQGKQGPKGAIGPKGDKGAIGPQGVNGPVGEKGAKGPQGPAGGLVGLNLGDMQYWDGKKWQIIPVIHTDLKIKPSLTICDGIPTWITQNCPGTLLYAVGDTGPAGGKVVYITEGGAHGIEAAPEDQSPSAQWGCVYTSIPNMHGVSIGTGAANTSAIILACNESNIAAQIADIYTLNGYSDWYLPSRNELNLLYTNRASLNMLAELYWSSSQYDSDYATGQFFHSSDFFNTWKSDYMAVRAIRSF